MAILKKPPQPDSAGANITKKELKDFSNWKNTLYTSSIDTNFQREKETQRKIMKCKICNEEYENLVTHFVTRHKESDLKSLSDINTVVHQIENSKEVTSLTIEEMKNRKCDFCGEIFFQTELLKNHIQTVHPESENSPSGCSTTTHRVFKIFPKVSNHEKTTTVSQNFYKELQYLELGPNCLLHERQISVKT